MDVDNFLVLHNHWVPDTAVFPMSAKDSSRRVGIQIWAVLKVKRWNQSRRFEVRELGRPDVGLTLL